MTTVVGIVIGVAFAALLTKTIMAYRENARSKYYCDSCSLYLGMGRQRERVCPNCGDFRYYTQKVEGP